ncbi:MAG: bacillithiol system redox-active protein YtxJ [Parcubacteria group bacterium SW_4_46_8]|nr:MAG: bacillithiol system redox-active protein YtxJ [Parcubacteria group bacterium SW_4_46_8]
MKALHKQEVWEKVLKQSQSSPVLVFKHSNTCPISEQAHKEIKALEQKSGFEDNMYIIVIQRAREISDTIEEDLDVTHESPQVIMIYNREAVYTEDHEDISAEKIAKELVRVKNEENKE